MGMNLRSLREEQKISLRKFGLMTGVDYHYISLIEYGEANPTIDTLEKLADGLGTDVHSLL